MNLDAPYLIYMREAREDDFHLEDLEDDIFGEVELSGESIDLLEKSSESESVSKKFAIFTANGECLTIAQNQDMALAWARENDLNLQSVH